MTFLAPVAGLIALGLALPPLLALYFLKLRRRPVRVSSTFLWAQAARDLQVNAPFRWLRLRTSLLLQLLALAALAGAIARPAIRSAGGVGGRIILVVDRSASMRALLASPADDANAQRTRFDEARAQARRLIDRLPRGAEAMILSFASAPRIEAAFTSDRAALRDALSRIAPTDEPDDFRRAIPILEAALSRAGEDAGSAGSAASVVIFSDGGFARRGAPMTAALGGADVRFVRAGPPPDAPDANLGVSTLAAERDFDDPRTLRLLVRFVNAGAAETEAAAGVYLDDAPIGVLAATVPAAGDSGPGEAVATLTVRSVEGGLLRVQLPAGDALASDDVAWSALPPASDLRVAVVSAKGVEADPFLLRALAAVGAARVETLDADAFRAALPDAPRRWDFIVFDRTPPTRPAGVSTLTFGVDPALPGVSFDAAAHAQRFAAWDRVRPLLRDVVLDAVVLADAPAFQTSGDARQQAQPIALSDAGALIVAYDGPRASHAAVSFPLSRSTWPLDPSFAVFIANALERLPAGGRRLSGRQWRTGQALVIEPAAGATRVRLLGPTQAQADVPPDVEAVSLGVASLVGVYRAQGAIPRDALLPVDLLDARESSLATAASLRLAGEDRPARAAADLAPREVWRWFVAIAAIVLTLDWLLYAFGMRVGRR